MPKTLEIIEKSLADIQSRGDSLLTNMGKLHDKFYNPTVGAWGRYYEGIDMLAEMADDDGADPGERAGRAMGDKHVAIFSGVEAAKADCVKISKAYWAEAKRAESVRDEALKLKTVCDAAIAKKAKKIKKSSSIDELREVSKKLTIYADHVQLVCMGGPQKPDHRLLK